MERLFYQDTWQGVPFRKLPIGDRSEVADHTFYATFYERLLREGFEPSATWRQRKRRFGAWIVSKVLSRIDGQRASRILSVGGGLGVVESVLTQSRYVVDVLECEPLSLRYLRSHVPGVGVMLGDARQIPCRSGSYDVAYLSNVDYCFTRDEYTEVLREMNRVLRSGGIAVSFCASNLSLNEILCGIRHLIKAPARSGEQLAWGYLRTIGEHVRAGRRAGLMCDEVHLFDREMNLRNIRSTRSVELGWPTWSEAEVAVVFTKAHQP